MSNLTANRRALLEMVLDIIELDLDAPENQELIQTTFAKIGAKIENYQWAYHHLSQQRESLMIEKQHIEDMIKKCDKAEERMSDYIKKVLNTLSVNELKGENGSKIYTKKYVSVEVYNESSLPDFCKTTKKVVTVNKTKLKEEMLAGLKVDGAYLIENTYGYCTKPKKLKVSTVNGEETKVLNEGLAKEK